MKTARSLLLTLCVFTLFVAACGAGDTTTPVTPPTAPTPTAETPTQTPIPLAASVNGVPITLAEYEAELARYELALGTDPATEGEQDNPVLDRLIERQLLSQAAEQLGFSLSQDELDQRLTALEADLGGPEALRGWYETNGFSPESFRQALQQEVLATYMLDEIAANVAASETQVHAAHILVSDPDLAQQLRDQIDDPADDFSALAVEYSMDLSTRVGGGDLGWFARGTLTTPELEEAAFSLEPGQVSQVVESSLGYHIVWSMDRQRRPLSFTTLAQRRQTAVIEWLADQKRRAEIQIYLEP